MAGACAVSTRWGLLALTGDTATLWGLGPHTSGAMVETPSPHGAAAARAPARLSMLTLAPGLVNGGAPLLTAASVKLLFVAARSGESAGAG
ncbi:hypothetical protein T492DRAFT_877915 [Pavlovales sp. CCMP2436]|nr:hypothetical protein T492DRAFT_877915 [Pavlovales sp. CCMP2436]